MNSADTGKNQVFEAIAAGLQVHGYAVVDAGVAPPLANELYEQALHTHESYQQARIGRGEELLEKTQVRGDKTQWIEGSTAAEAAWLQWANELRNYLNRELYIGINSFESHFAHYAPGTYYEQHFDSFQGNNSRLVSVIAYLNPEWSESDGGQLSLVDAATDKQLMCIEPAMGKVVVFMSSDFPHAVLATHKNRYSVSGWFRRD